MESLTMKAIQFSCFTQSEKTPKNLESIEIIFELDELNIEDTLVDSPTPISNT